MLEATDAGTEAGARASTEDGAFFRSDSRVSNLPPSLSQQPLGPDGDIRPLPSAPPSLASVRLRYYAVLLVIDAVAVTTGFLFGNMLRFGNPVATAGLNYLAVFLPVFLAISFSQRSYAIDAIQSSQTGAFRALKSLAVTACTLLLALFYAKTSAVMSRAVFGTALLTAGPLLMMGRHFFVRDVVRRHRGTFQSEVLIVDRAGATRSDADCVIDAKRVGLDPFENGPVMAERIGQMLNGYDRVILDCAPQRRLQWARCLKGLGVDVEVLTPELDYLGALALRRSSSGAALLVSAGPLGLRDRVLKRGLDLTLGSLMLIFFAPLMLFLAALVRFTSPGPLLFGQWRIGKGNRPFRVLKFRTMKVEASDARGVQSARKDDDRLTLVGSFLRRTSLDELPQLLNVLAGEMSIVGPRPHAPGSTAEDDLFWDIDDRYWERGAVKPGITGLAQVRGFRGATGTRKDVTDRVQADLEYLANWSISKDLVIIWRTFRVLVHPNAF